MNAKTLILQAIETMTNEDGSLNVEVINDAFDAAIWATPTTQTQLFAKKILDAEDAGSPQIDIVRNYISQLVKEHNAMKHSSDKVKHSIKVQQCWMMLFVLAQDGSWQELEGHKRYDIQIPELVVATDDVQQLLSEYWKLIKIKLQMHQGFTDATMKPLRINQDHFQLKLCTMDMDMNKLKDICHVFLESMICLRFCRILGRMEIMHDDVAVVYIDMIRHRENMQLVDPLQDQKQ